MFEATEALRTGIAAGEQITCAVVRHVTADGELAIVATADAVELHCRIMQASDAAPLTLCAGDTVVVWRMPTDTDTAIVLGRLGRPQPPVQVEAPPTPDVPDELVIEARESLTLKCGDGSITIRADGRILIKGRDLVSHAQRTNRIRGGSVAIN